MIFQDTNINLDEFLNSFQTLKLKIFEEKHIFVITLNRPKQLNSLNEALFTELEKVFKNIENIMKKVDIRVVIINGEGKSFCAGLDLKSNIVQHIADTKNDLDAGRKAYFLYQSIRKMQESLMCIESSPLPVIASIHGYCLGGAMTITHNCDFRLATKDSIFSIKEIDLGITADIGVIQKIIKQTGREGLMRKLTYTGEKFNGERALKYGLVDEIYENFEELQKETLKIAEEIAKKSPLAIWGIKRTYNFSRENSLSASLEMVRTLNSGLLQTMDIGESVKALVTKGNTKFAKL